MLQELEWDNLAVSEWKTLERISGEDFTTVSSVIPAILELTLHLEEVCYLYF